MRLLLLIPLLADFWLLVGCSPTARVAHNSTMIQSEAQALIDRGEATGDKEVVKHAERIYGLASDIHGQLPYLEDRVPPWLTTLWWCAAAAIVIGICVILWQTGIGTAIRVAIGWIPRKKVVDADLAAGMLDPDKPEDAREYVAARRASDPEFDAAWRRIHKEKS